MHLRIMTATQVIERANELGAFRRGHVVLSSGRHAWHYIDKYAISSLPTERGSLPIYRSLAALWADTPIDVVVGPERGGIILTQWVAYFLARTQHRPIRAEFAQRTSYISPCRFEFPERAHTWIRGARVLVVEDTITTGLACRDVVQACRKLDPAEVVGAGVIFNREDVIAAALDVPELRVLAPYRLPSWTPEECRGNGPCRGKLPTSTALGKGASQPP